MSRLSNQDHPPARSAAHHFGFGLGALREALLEDRRNFRVQCLSSRQELRLISRVSEQGVFEGVARIGWSATLMHDLRGCELIESVAQGGGVEIRHGFDELVAELAPQRGSLLSYVLRRAQAIEPRHQRVLQRRGDRQVLDAPGQLVAPGLLGHDARGHDIARELLDEERRCSAGSAFPTRA